MAKEQAGRQEALEENDTVVLLSSGLHPSSRRLPGGEEKSDREVSKPSETNLGGDGLRVQTRARLSPKSR